jgi:hypothetical protein
VLGVRQLLGFVVAVEPFEFEQVHTRKVTVDVGGRFFPKRGAAVPRDHPLAFDILLASPRPSEPLSDVALPHCRALGTAFAFSATR